MDEYEVKGYPTIFLINPEGVIVETNLGWGALENKILRLTNEMNPTSNIAFIQTEYSLIDFNGWRYGQ